MRSTRASITSFRSPVFSGLTSPEFSSRRGLLWRQFRPYSQQPQSLPVHQTLRRPRTQQIQIIRPRYYNAPAKFPSPVAWVRENTRKAWKEEPVTFAIFTGATVCSLAVLGYLLYRVYFYSPPEISPYPPAIQQLLRRAIFHTEIKFDPDQAFAYYVLALQAADNNGLDPLSDEILGIRIRLTAMLEKAGRVKAAVEILEEMSSDCLAYISDYDDGKLEKVKEATQGAAQTIVENVDAMKEEGGESRRSRLFKKAIECRTKAAELYDSDYIQDPNQARDTLAKTFEMVLRQAQKEGSDIPRGMTGSEVAYLIEPLAELYLRDSLPGLAIPLELHALQLLRDDEGRPTCKQVLIMTNISSALAMTKTMDSRLPETVLTNARQWADKALEVCAHIKPPQREQACDFACVTATFNIGEIARLSGNSKEAKRKYDEAMSLAKAIGQPDVVLQRMQQSVEALK